MPAGVAHGVVERRADRAVGRFEVGAPVDECGGHIDVVAARGVVQRRLGTGPGVGDPPPVVRALGSAPASTSRSTTAGPFGK